MIAKIKEKIKDKKSSSYFWILKKEYLSYIQSETTFLENPTFNERLYCLINNIDSIPKCLSCNNKVKFTNFTKGYKLYCSLSCSRKSKETLKKRQTTMLNKFGTLAPNRLKMQKTNLEKYGTKYPNQSEEIKRKTKKTNLMKYGVENISQVEEIKKKKEETNKKIYGVKTNLLDKQTIEKIKRTNLERYGFENPTKSIEIKEKTKKTNLNRYGVEYFTESLNYKQKRYKKLLTNLDKVLKDFNLKRNFKDTEYIGGYTLKNGKRVETKKYSITCLKCKGSFDVSLADGNIPTNCYICEKQKGGTSKLEDEIDSFLKSLNIPYKRNDRKKIKPLEIDFLINDKIGIELNGLYFHSYEYLNKDNLKEDIYIENGLIPNKGKNFHLLKTKLAEKENLELFHIMENEWIEKKEIVKSMIKYQLGLIENKINARDLKIKEISTIKAKEFLEENHLQGATNSSIRYGLVDEEWNIYSLMTFSKNRYSEEDFELVRFANLKNHIIRGGASKLLKAFKKEHKGSIITFADRRHSQGNLYKTLGFKEKYILEPQYKYIKNGKLFHRMFFQKKNIKKMYENYKDKRIHSSGFGLIKKYDEELTGEENLLRNHIYKIYDSGHIKYVLK
jgi:hypothetical protein